MFILAAYQGQHYQEFCQTVLLVIHVHNVSCADNGLGSHLRYWKNGEVETNFKELPSSSLLKWSPSLPFLLMDMVSDEKCITPL